VTVSKYWIALDQVSGIGPAHLITLHKALRERDLSIADIFFLEPGEIRNEFDLPEKTVDSFPAARSVLSRIENDYLKLLESGVETLLFFEDLYPPRLTSILKNQLPPILYLFGNREILKKRGAAVLGDRNVSEKGSLISYLAAKKLCSHNIAVISGFARGADIIAHRSALENNGNTIAVLPHGMLNLSMPESFAPVFDPSRTLFVSPFPPSMEYSPYNSLSRNKIIAALSYAVFIVEAPVESGIFEAGKSTRDTGTPLYVTQYSQYPDSAAGNTRLIQEFGGIPVRGRMEQDRLVPNLEKLIGSVKFAD
jgi:DNA protecting protein DprA